MNCHNTRENRRRSGLLDLPACSSRHSADSPRRSENQQPQQATTTERRTENREPRTDIHFVFISKTLHELIYLLLISGLHHTSASTPPGSRLPSQRPCLSSLSLFASVRGPTRHKVRGPSSSSLSLNLGAGSPVELFPFARLRLSADDSRSYQLQQINKAGLESC